MLIESPQVLIAEEEKIIVEETRGAQTVVEEKYAFIFDLQRKHSQIVSLTS